MSGWLSRLVTRRERAPDDSSLATRDDIAACFRLLLGRRPNPEEVSGHMDQAGQPLPTVVAGYLNSLEFANRGLMRPQRPRPQMVRFGDYGLYVDVDDVAVGRHVARGEYEPEVTAVMRRLIGPGMGVLDLGANVGFFSMLAADVVGRDGFVLAIEPNPDNTVLLEASRKVNGFEQLSVVQLAASDRLGVLTLNATHSNGTTSPLPDEIDRAVASRTVACAPIDLLVPAGRRVDVIKIDVEGAEYLALTGARQLLERDRPVIVSEFSPGLLPGISGVDGPAYLQFLFRLGYRVSVIQPDGSASAGGRAAGPIMDAYAERGNDHIDLLAEPG